MCNNRKVSFAVTIVVWMLLCILHGSVASAMENSFSTETLKVMSINIRHNKDFADERLPLIADEIVRLKPDVIGIQEMHIGSLQSKHLLRLIRERASDTNYFVYERLKTGVDIFAGEGISIFSRFPIEKESFRDIENARVVLFTRLRVNDALTIDFYNTHLHNLGGDSVRRQQAKLIVKFMKSNNAGFPTFLTGDMNSTPDAGTIDEYRKAGLVDSYPAFHASDGDPGYTSSVVLAKNNPIQNFTHRIDYVFYQPGKVNMAISDSVVCFKNANADGLYPSDHLGVMTTFEITELH